MCITSNLPSTSIVHYKALPKSEDAAECIVEGESALCMPQHFFVYIAPGFGGSDQKMQLVHAFWAAGGEQRAGEGLEKDKPASSWRTRPRSLTLMATSGLTLRNGGRFRTMPLRSWMSPICAVCRAQRGANLNFSWSEEKNTLLVHYLS